ncbi:MAG: helix-turn-helix domain-containing protein [Candidatus Omnitrophica bacterium]|nr:helix-turn-helix domain-containing protein [Candidatus Omnitrophota bacterium]MBU1127891.1 helix-turn-helix domain-containing protein [Candidatus Omnitrophota bacterium]MBU1784193.1 helix-turn-helix domain-containing protein [Candidatus Omnitrophota bacterium]MBU1851490.1 helix-turn-helix domain-containing protein [Candidatus Omnitrophota bacterium]
MKVNWLWDSRLKESAAKKILKNAEHAKFDIYAEKLLSRVGDPKMVFGIIDKVVFCKKWPRIKKRMRKDRWLNNRVTFWQTMYECIHEQLKKQGIKIRSSQETELPAKRMKLAQQIRAIRIKSGYTQKDLAEKLGVIQQYISRIENGHENFSIDTLTRIADVFGKRLVVKLK